MSKAEGAEGLQGPRGGGEEGGREAPGEVGSFKPAVRFTEI